MTKTINTLTSSDAAITKAILSVHKRSASLQMDIQKVLVAVCTRWAQTKDMRPAVSHINQLLTKGELTALRTNSIREWVETYMGLTINEDSRMFSCPSSVTNGAHLNLKVLTNARWWDFDGGEKPYIPLTNPSKLLNQLIGKMKKDREKLGDGSKVDPVMLDALREVATPTVMH